MTSAKEEVLKALDHLIARLAGDEPLAGLERFQLRAAAQYAMDRARAIQEVKRVRRPVGVDSPALEAVSGTSRSEESGGVNGEHGE